MEIQDRLDNEETVSTTP